MELHTTLKNAPSTTDSLVPTQTTAKTTLHLIELSPDLQSAIKNGLKLTLKSSSSATNSRPYLTTHDKTFKIRVQNHSNCQLLSHLSGNKGTAFARFDKILVPTLSKNVSLESSSLRTINNMKELSTTQLSNEKNEVELFQRLFNNSPCSDAQFKKLVSERAIFAVAGGVSELCILSDRFLIRFIVRIVKFLLEIFSNEMTPSEAIINARNSANSNNFEENDDWHILKRLSNISVEEIYQAIDSVAQEYHVKYNQKLLSTRIAIAVCCKFFKLDIELPNVLTNNLPLPTDQFPIDYQRTLLPSGIYTFQHQILIRLIGLEILREFGRIKRDELMIQTKMNLPADYTPDVDILNVLSDVCYLEDQDGDEPWVNYLDQSFLSEDPATRFKELFKRKKEWELKEIEPFVKSVNVRALKLEKFCLKWCKVRKIKKKVILSDRY
ncbi:hypothetical protein DAMA08_024870 [Martiniozyma asiatica (nom. inval.)]|nr:hypothetical protein DAMA08_024870 [Martiniozyma asiatica]